MHGPLSLKNKLLSTPLIQISKTSTPIRSRVISSPMNSTPINQLKLSCSPISVKRQEHNISISNENENKQNLSDNYGYGSQTNSTHNIKLRQSRNIYDSNGIQNSNNIANNKSMVMALGFKKGLNHNKQVVSFAECKQVNQSGDQVLRQKDMNRSGNGLNLSPILALNKRLTSMREKITRNDYGKAVRNDTSNTNANNGNSLMTESGNGANISNSNSTDTNNSKRMRQSGQFSQLALAFNSNNKLSLANTNSSNCNNNINNSMTDKQPGTTFAIGNNINNSNIQQQESSVSNYNNAQIPRLRSSCSMLNLNSVRSPSKSSLTKYRHNNDNNDSSSSQCYNNGNNNLPNGMMLSNSRSFSSSGVFSSLSRKKQSLIIDTVISSGRKQLNQSKQNINSNQYKGQPSLINSKSQSSLISSKSMSSLINNTPQQLLYYCSNRHNKVAKYKIKSSISLNESHNNIKGQQVYCSKCAIDLVQRGYTVEEICTNNNVEVSENSIVKRSHVSSRDMNSFMNSSQQSLQQNSINTNLHLYQSRQFNTHLRNSRHFMQNQGGLQKQQSVNNNTRKPLNKRSLSTSSLSLQSSPKMNYNLTPIGNCNQSSTTNMGTSSSKQKTDGVSLRVRRQYESLSPLKLVNNCNSNNGRIQNYFNSSNNNFYVNEINSQSNRYKSQIRNHNQQPNQQFLREHDQQLQQSPQQTELAKQHYQIDCYYNSVIAYIEQQRLKDKQFINESNNRSNRNSSMMTGSCDIRKQEWINTRIQPSIQQQFDRFVEYFDKEGRLQIVNTRQIKYNETTRTQLSNDNDTKSRRVPSTHPLRFSFQKALQLQKLNNINNNNHINSNNNNKNKNSLASHKLSTQYECNALLIPQQQDDQSQYYDQNSFNHYYHNQQQQSLQHPSISNQIMQHHPQSLYTNNILQNQYHQEQQQQQQHMFSLHKKQYNHQPQTKQPFRTLFAEDQDILNSEIANNLNNNNQHQGSQVKNDVYSPMFKAI